MVKCSKVRMTDRVPSAQLEARRLCTFVSCSKQTPQQILVPPSLSSILQHQLLNISRYQALRLVLETKINRTHLCLLGNQKCNGEDSHVNK